MCVNVAVCPQDPNICVSIETVLGGMHFVFATSIFDVLLVYDYPWAKGPKHKTMLLRPWKDHTHDNSRVQSPSKATRQRRKPKINRHQMPNAKGHDSMPTAATPCPRRTTRGAMRGARSPPRQILHVGVWLIGLVILDMRIVVRLDDCHLLQVLLAMWRQ